MVYAVAMKHSCVRIISRREARRQLNAQETFQNVACENAVDAARQSAPRRLGLPSTGTVGGNHDEAGAATAVQARAKAPCAHGAVCVCAATALKVVATRVADERSSAAAPRAEPNQCRTPQEEQEILAGLLSRLAASAKRSAARRAAVHRLRRVAARAAPDTRDALRRRQRSSVVRHTLS
jgi:hypothetical protein